MRRIPLLLLVFMSLGGISAAAAPTTLRLDGLGPLKLGMSRSDAVATGWLSHRSAGCELASPRPVVYQLQGPKAPRGLRGSVEFAGGKLTNFAVRRGARTALGIRPNVNTPSGMARVYRRAGYKVSVGYEATFQATFVTVKRRGKRVLSAVATGRRIDTLSVPSTAFCE